MANILLGVSGGIAAYKSCELVREFRRAGHSVRVIMTEAAQKFVTQITFEALTRSPVYTDLFGDGAFGTAHIEVARWANALVIAPATANTLYKMANGQADDFLSTVYLAYRGVVFVAPAMNTQMWEHPAVRQNLSLLKKRDVQIIPPVPGELACGEVGEGKMAEPLTIVDSVSAALPPPATTSLTGKKVVITAGPTREYIDPVRFISNPSSGKMGIALANEALHRGAEVTLIHGPLAQALPARVRSIAVTTAAEMSKAVQKAWPADIFVGAAAVTDYAPQKTLANKQKRETHKMDLHLTQTPDILKWVGKHRTPKNVVVGFAAETEEVLKHGQDKLKEKDLDVLVANPVFKEKRGFVQDKTDVFILDRKGRTEEFRELSKDQVAHHLWDRVESLYASHPKRS